VEAFPVPGTDGVAVIGLRDRSGLSDVALSLSEPALRILSYMDGTNTCEDICRAFTASSGQILSGETLQAMLDHLEQAHLLEGPGFERFYQERLEEYRVAGNREMPHAAGLGIVDASGAPFEDMLRGTEAPVLPGLVRGLIAPHLDYPRGRPAYAAAYGAVRARRAPDRVVVLGTNHFGRGMSVTATAADFTTPLGRTCTDLAFLERIEAQCGTLRAYELDHVPEHSVELQVAWLQHLFGPNAFEIVPFLCPDPCGSTGTAPPAGDGVDLRVFAETLGEVVADDRRDTLIVAGADLSHVGAPFGDERKLDDGFLEAVRQRDRCVLDKLEVNDPEGLLRCVAEDGNATRVCSAGCIYVLCVALPNASGTVLRYHQAVDQPSQTGVTCAAVAFA
jgi:AmmeMemoRadiSam system protein B